MSPRLFHSFMPPDRRPLIMCSRTIHELRRCTSGADSARSTSASRNCPACPTFDAWNWNCNPEKGVGTQQTISALKTGGRGSCRAARTGNAAPATGSAGASPSHAGRPPRSVAAQSGHADAGSFRQGRGRNDRIQPGRGSCNGGSADCQDVFSELRRRRHLADGDVAVFQWKHSIDHRMQLVLTDQFQHRGEVGR